MNPGLNIYAMSGPELIVSPMVSGGWNLQNPNGGWSISSGVLSKAVGTVGVGAVGPNSSGMTGLPSPGTVYRVTIICTAQSGGGLSYSLGGVQGSNITVGTIVDDIAANSAAPFIFQTTALSGQLNVTVTITSISIKALTVGQSILEGPLTMGGPILIQQGSMNSLTSPGIAAKAQPSVGLSFHGFYANPFLSNPLVGGAAAVFQASAYNGIDCIFLDAAGVPTARIDNAGTWAGSTGMILSGFYHATYNALTGEYSEVESKTGIADVLEVRSDVQHCIVSQATGVSGATQYIGLDANGYWRCAVDEYGASWWGMSTGTYNSGALSQLDTQLYRYAPTCLALGNGTANDTSGILALNAVVMKDTATGQYYSVQITNGALVLTACAAP